MAIEEGVHRTDSLSQVPTPEVKSPSASQITSRPIPVTCVEANTATSMRQESSSQSVTCESTNKVSS